MMVRHGRPARHSYGRVALILASALLRWPSCAIERLRVAGRVKAVAFDPPPVFIVGHWRSGTTFLHNLMSLDGAFCSPTILEVLRPHDFFPSPAEFISRALLLRFLPSTRPMDDVELNAVAPQEEEFALASMGAPSFLNCIYFPARMTEVFAEQVLLADPADESAWRECLMYFLAKLAALNPGRRLLLKNPANSARVPLLRALFPGAKFIHIHRDPLAVFHSTRKLYDRMLPLLALQNYRPADLDSHILSSYPELMNRLLDALADLPRGHATTIRYDELTADPIHTLQRIYDELNLGDFSRVEPSIRVYAAEHRQAATPMPDNGCAERLAQCWGPVYARLGYPSLGSVGDSRR